MLYRPILSLGLLALLVLPVAAGAQAAKTVSVTLPEGDATQGRATFLEMGCSSCHQVLGEEDFPQPVSPNRGPSLGSYQARQEPARLAMSIYTPSHEISGTVRGDRGDKLSPMPDFTNVVTVRQFLDLIAFIRSLDGGG